MITPEQRDELVNFNANGQAVLSVYLDLSPDRQVQRSYQVIFQDLARQCEAELDHDEAKAFRAEAEKISDFLEDDLREGKGVALFSCAARDFWRVYFVPVAFQDEIFYGGTPWLRPLVGMMDDYGRYAIALVDKEKARIISVNLGQIEDEQDITDDVPGKHDQGGWSQANYQRHHENAVHQHLKNVCIALDATLEVRPFERLVLAGPDEALVELERMLTRPLQERLVGTCPGELFASTADVVERANEIVVHAEREKEAGVVDQIIEFSGARGRATLNLPPTLDALFNGQVDLLVVADDAQAPGGECPACGRMVAGGRPTCPACGSPMDPVDDIVGLAMTRTLGQSGRVEVVRGAAATRLHAESDGVGALLRYTIATASEHDALQAE
jgi:peptide chain release factor subunit 1